MNHLRQGVLLWEIPPRLELPQTTEQRCRELLSQMLLSVATNIAGATDMTVDNKEESDE